MSRAAIAIFPVIIIAAALSAFVIYMIIYSARINKRVTSGERKKSHLLSSGSFGLTVLVVAMVIGIVTCLSKISTLQNELYNERNNFRTMYDSLDEKIISIEETLRKQQSLFSSTEMSAGKYNEKTHTGDIFVTLTPKTLHSDTEVTLTAGGKEYKGERKGSAFAFTVKFDIIKDRGDFFDFVASVTSGSETKTETLENMNFYDAEQKFINIIFASCSFPFEYKDGKASINPQDSPLNIEVCGVGENTFESAKAVIEKNGVVVSEKDITAYFTSQKNDYSFSVPINESFDAQEGDIFVVYVTARDSFGLTHKAKAMQCEIQSDNYVYEVAFDSNTDYELSIE